MVEVLRRWLLHAFSNCHGPSEANYADGPYLYTAIVYHEIVSYEQEDGTREHIDSAPLALRVVLENWSDPPDYDVRPLVEKGKDSGLPAGAIGGPPLPFDAALVRPKYVSAYRLYGKQTDADAIKPDDAVFIKKLFAVDWANPDECEKYRTWVEEEVRILEKLAHTPHPNIVAFRGCVVEDGLIAGIALEACVNDLRGRLQDTTTPLDVDECLAQVTAALTHLHGLGYCHNDVKPENIMFRADDTAVLIDFDSCLPAEARLDAGKGTTPLWADPASKTSSVTNDWHALARLEQFVRDPTADEWGDDKVIYGRSGGRSGGSGGSGGGGSGGNSSGNNGSGSGSGGGKDTPASARG